MKQKVLVIVGPTASGKSALGVELARTFNGEIISADSRQVYKGLDIGTGKITHREMKGVPHHLLDIASPKKTFSAGDFATSAARAITSIALHKKLPIVVGGTGFYIDALLGRMPLPEVSPNVTLRNKLRKKTAAQLYALLTKKDVRRAKAMSTPSERNNKVRLIRALEIAEALGRNPAPIVTDTFDVMWIGIAPPLKTLEKKIATRLSSRISAGMIHEAQKLHKAGLSYKRMEELGLEYRSLSRLLQMKLSKMEFESELYRDIRRYAKRQGAYWKRNADIHWHSAPTVVPIARQVKSWLRNR